MRESLIHPGLLTMLFGIVHHEADAVLRGTFAETEGAIAFWDRFMEIKHVLASWRRLPARPRCGVGLHYPLQAVSEEGDVLRIPRCQIRLNLGTVKARFHPPSGEESGSPGVMIYCPFWLDELISADVLLLLLEAPHHALRVGALQLEGALDRTLLPVSALGIANIGRVSELLHQAGYTIAAIICDQPPRGVVLARACDLDRIDNRALVDLITGLVRV